MKRSICGSLASNVIHLPSWWQSQTGVGSGTTPPRQTPTLGWVGWPVAQQQCCSHDQVKFVVFWGGGARGWQYGKCVYAVGVSGVVSLPGPTHPHPLPIHALSPPTHTLCQSMLSPLPSTHTLCSLPVPPEDPCGCNALTHCLKRGTGQRVLHWHPGTAASPAPGSQAGFSIVTTRCTQILMCVGVCT